MTAHPDAAAPAYAANVPLRSLRTEDDVRDYGGARAARVSLPTRFEHGSMRARHGAAQLATRSRIQDEDGVTGVSSVLERTG